MKFNLLLLVIFCAIHSFSFAQTKIKVACVGNSITQGPGRTDAGSYPLQMQEILGDKYEVRNFGVSGRTLLKKGDYPYWNEPQFEEVKNFAPDILVIKLGTNDSKPQNWQHKEDFKKDYLELIQTFKQNMPKKGKVYICLPVPVFKENYSIRESVLVEEMRPILLEIAAETKATIIDLYNPLLNKSELLPDGVHPNEEGLGIMAAQVAKHVKKKK
jgi:acyl-CoA thioesterase I